MTVGIYSITNTLDGKRYIGKSVNIEGRFSGHRSGLSKPTRGKDVNRHLYNAVRKYGLENFKFEIIDVCDRDSLPERELYWMDFYNSCNREFGYNLRRDSSSGMFVSEETRELKRKISLGENNPNYQNYWSEEDKIRMSAIKKQQHLSGIYDESWRAKISVASSETWKDEDKKKQMAKRVSVSKSTLRFYQYDKKTNVLIRVWESMSEILSENPTYHNIAIYSVCNGHKKSYRGYKWVSESKI